MTCRPGAATQSSSCVTTGTPSASAVAACLRQRAAMTPEPALSSPRGYPEGADVESVVPFPADDVPPLICHDGTSADPPGGEPAWRNDPHRFARSNRDQV